MNFTQDTETVIHYEDTMAQLTQDVSESIENIQQVVLKLFVMF